MLQINRPMSCPLCAMPESLGGRDSARDLEHVGIVSSEHSSSLKGPTTFKAYVVDHCLIHGQVLVGASNGGTVEILEEIGK